MKHFLGLITRCKDEFFAKEFCYYYLSQGVDHVYIIDDDSDNKSIYDGIESDKATIHFQKNIIQKDCANMVYSAIKDRFEWIIYVDMDEFICTNATSNLTIKEIIKNDFHAADCVKIPWVMMACNGRSSNPNRILTENTYRWNHDLKHPNKIHKFRCRYEKIEVKCIFRSKKFNKIWDHHPLDPSAEKIRIVNSINLEDELLTPFYQELREEHILKGKLLCYHYRIISKENSTNKIKTNYWYIKNKYTVEDLHSSDHPEKIDTTLRSRAKDLNIYHNF